MTLSPPLQNPSAPRPSLKKTPYEGPKTNSATMTQLDCSLIKEMSKNFMQKRRLFNFRHAERVDVTFGKQWIQLSFDTNGCYHRRNLNMPKEIPKRKGGPSDFMKDSPITETGFFQSRLMGEGMREQGIRIQYIYCSPTLRCVQTANAIVQGLQDPSIKLSS